jgi:NADH dehydrogenase [ubiquinone] 1 alpha subcomplex assembly factor 5
MIFMTQDHRIFDRKRVRTHRDRAANTIETHDFLLREMADRLADRLLDIRKTFPRALELGAHNGVLAEYIPKHAGIETLVQTDLSHAMVMQAKGQRVVADEEYLPFAANSFDLVMSVGSLHWVNDVPGTLIQIQRILKPGGLFLCMLSGGETLKELRHGFEKAEIKITGGISPRISPFIDVKDAGSLLQRAGFCEPVSDSEIVNVAYETPLQLLHDLRAMGETSALISGSKACMRRALFAALLDEYKQHFTGDNGRVNATFEWVTLTAWKSDDAT